MVALVVFALPLSGCKEHKVVQQYHPASLSETDQKGIMRVTLNDERAAERIGLETAPIREELVTVGNSTVTRKVVPYGAILYDKKGETWTFTNPQGLSFVRAKISVESIDGDRVVLAEGPPVGTMVVTVGAAELQGAEHKYGH